MRHKPMNRDLKVPRLAVRLAGLLRAAALPLAAAGQDQTKLDRTVLPIAEPKRPVYTEIDTRNIKVPPRFEFKANSIWWAVAGSKAVFWTPFARCGLY
jgi:hypothetical protein